MAMKTAAMGGDAITVIAEGGCVALDPDLAGGRHPVIAGRPGSAWYPRQISNSANGSGLYRVGIYRAVSKKAKVLCSLLFHCSVCPATPFSRGTITTATTMTSHDATSNLYTRLRVNSCIGSSDC